MRNCYNDFKDYGAVQIKLQEYLDKHNITRNALSMATGIRYDVIDRYYKGQIMRIDLDNLAKICYALECKLSDIIEYKF